MTKYKAEVIHNKTVVKEYTKIATHPNQIVRSTLTRMKANDEYFDYFIVCVANEYGHKWIYYVRRDEITKRYHITSKKSDTLLTKDEVDLVFSGNKNIGDFA